MGTLRPPPKLKAGGHSCEMPREADYSEWGHAIRVCLETSHGTLWVDGDEYSSQVNYCPVCGLRASVQIGEPLKEEA